MQSNELKIRCVVPCLLGLESLIAQELRDMGAIDVAAENGRVLFSGDANLLARANINCRFAERIQILIGSFPARTFDELFEGTKSASLGSVDRQGGCLPRERVFHQLSAFQRE